MVKRNTTLRSFINNESTKGGLGAHENIVLSRKNDTLEQDKNDDALCGDHVVISGYLDGMMREGVRDRLRAGWHTNQS